ncbi:MAG: DUF1800 domain-containing protein [Bacteroidota bacterium]
MKRRDFLRKHTAVLSTPSAAITGSLASPQSTDDPTKRKGKTSPSKPTSSSYPPTDKETSLPSQELAPAFANQIMPAIARTAAGLEPYTGSWGYAQAAHLLRRCMFGPTRTEIETAAASSMNAVVAQLLTPAPTPIGPLNAHPNSGGEFGKPWTNEPFNWDYNGYRNYSLVTWWTGLLLNQGVSLTEKMTLFWHNHFVTSTTIYSPHMSYNYQRKLRKHALGNFKTLAEVMTIDEAMLVYLNGFQNEVKGPNENYARELLELFTLGKGPLIGPGNYTHYTEDDVKAAAKVLTGWYTWYQGVNPDDGKGIFHPERHDTSTKQFSAAFQNRKITNTGNREYLDLLNMIFAQASPATFLCRKLYRWFVYYVIDEAAEQNVIQPMAKLLRDNNYEVAPVLKALFSSAHFYDIVNVGCLIKSPLEHNVGLFRQLEAVFPPASQPSNRYWMWELVNWHSKSTYQEIGFPPVVAGWPAYYQAPQFNELWASSVTMPLRKEARRSLIQDQGYYWQNTSVNINLIALIQRLPAEVARDVNQLVTTFARLLISDEPNPARIPVYKEALLGNLPDFEWKLQWNDFLANPTDNNKREAVLGKLKNLFHTLTDEVEFQLL